MSKFLLIVMLLFVGVANAQQTGFQLGSFTLFPTVGVSYGYSDNVAYSSDESSQESSPFLVFSPGLRIERIGDRTDFNLQYNFTKTAFTSVDDNDFFDHNTVATFGYDASHRNRFEISTEYTDGTDRRGTKNQQGNLLNLNLDPDEFHAYGVSGSWLFGGNSSRGNLGVTLGRLHRDYDNNRVYTATRDRQTYYLDGTYSHRVSPKTTLLANVGIANIEYDFANLDSSERRLMLGAEWNTTGKTSARALIGFLEKNFEDDQYEDFTGLAVDVGVQYKIRSYSRVNLSLSRETNETNGVGHYALTNAADLGWTHDWKNKITTTASTGIANIGYEGSDRDDRLKYYGLTANYHFNKWFNSGVGYRRTMRSSSVDEFEYDDDSLNFTIELSK